MTAAVQVNPLIEWMDRYQPSAELFVREVFGFPNDEELAEGKEIYPWQSEALAAYDRREPRIAIRSGHGVGKSTFLAWIMWHHILTRFPQKTGVTAPSEKQLFDALWAEFEAWGNRLPRPIRSLVEIKADSAELVARPAESFISIKTARAEQPEALQGLHSTWTLIIADEASGVPESVWEAAGSSLTGPHPMAVLTGNPVRASGFFFMAHTSLSDVWWTKHVPCSEVPTATAAYAQLMERTYGTNSNVYRVRVLGEFPVSEDDVLIPFDLVEPALTRDVTVHRSAPTLWGLDCARFGSNRSALAKRQGQQLLEPVRWWAKLDTMELSARVKVEWDSTPDFLRPVAICVDAIGVGGGVVDRLKELGLPAKGINVSETPALKNEAKYDNLRTELWFTAREWFEKRDCKLPESYKRPEIIEGRRVDLVGELTQQRYDFQRKSGKIYVTPKIQAHSPDLADAFVLTFAADAVTLARGRDQARRPFKPRLIKGLV
jgi:phage terminase large subunit